MSSNATLIFIPMSYDVDFVFALYIFGLMVVLKKMSQKERMP
jgi:hypothetical protein